MIDDPTHVRFVPSADHESLTRYELRTVAIPSNDTSDPTPIGVPVPDEGGLCTATVATNAWTEGVEHRVEVRSVRGTDASAWEPSTNTGQITVPAPVSGYGPQAAIGPPEGAVMLPAGGTSADLVALIAANPAGTVFGIAAGVHVWSHAVFPKAGNSFIGEYGAILDGDAWTTADTDAGAFKGAQSGAGVSNVTIKNLVIRKMPKRGISTQAPLASGWLIEYNEITGCKTTDAAGITAPSNATVRHNNIHHNIGGGYGSYRANLGLWEHNEFAYNGAECKFVKTTGVTFRNNYCHHNHDGVWYDADNLNILIEDNRLEDNTRNGIFYEVSGNAIIRNNTIRRNGTVGVDSGIFVSCSKNGNIYDNIIEDNFRAVTYYVDCDRVGAGAIGWDLKDTTTHDNTIRVPTGVPNTLATSLQCGSLCSAEAKALYASGAKNLVFQGNAYDVPNPSGNAWYWNGAKSWAAWQALGHDTTGSVT